MVDPKLLELVHCEESSQIPPLNRETPYTIGKLVSDTLGETFDPRKIPLYLEKLQEARNESYRLRQEEERKRKEAHDKRIAEIAEKNEQVIRKTFQLKTPSGKFYEIDEDYEWTGKEYRVSTVMVGFGKESIEKYEKGFCPLAGRKVPLRPALDPLFKQLAETHGEMSIAQLCKVLLATPITIGFGCGAIDRQSCDFFRECRSHHVELTLVAK